MVKKPASPGFTRHTSEVFLRVRTESLSSRAAPYPPEAPEVKQERERVWQAISHVPGVGRSGLLLGVLEDLPYEEIAALLRISVTAANLKVHRVRLRLGAICCEAI